MENLFLKLLNMSITAGWLIIAVLALRFILKKAPKAINCFLWGLVGFRLICPVSFESILSLIPSTETVPDDILYSNKPTINSGVSFLNSAVNPIISDSLSPNAADSVNPMQIIVFIASAVWITGIVIMLLYTLISYFKLYRQTNESIKLENNIYICDRIDTPFILGIIRPKIFLPSDMNERDIEYVIAHEKAHLKRCDHLWKPLGFFLLTLYWFNPLIWVAYIILCRDIELACDERVIKDMGEDYKKSYSTALINCSISKKAIRACPLAFGEVGVKSRIKTVLSYKKPTLWIILIGVILSITLSVCFVTNPTDMKITQIDEETVNFGTMFNDIEQIVLTSGDKTYTVIDDDSINSIIASIKNIKIKSRSLILSRDENRDKTHRINLGANTLCFNKDFSKVWIYTGVKPTFTYKVLNTDVVSEIFSMIDYDKITSSFIVTNIGSDIKGISIALENFELDCDKPYITVKYINSTSEEFLYGEMFDILYLKDDEFISCAKNEVFFNLLAYKLKPYSGATHTYYISDFDLSNDGAYRFKIPASDNKYLWFDFNISNKQIAETAFDVYGYRDSPDSMMPTISLSRDSDRFSFRYSGFSSYIPSGTYSLTDSKLILTTDDTFRYKYVFDRNGNNFIFNENKSALIPKYKYYSSGDAVSPVPDGAVFELYAPLVTSGSIIDGYNFDIDSDGIIEHCALFYGPTSGIFTFNFKVFEGDKLEYANTFSFEHSNIFFKEINSKLVIDFMSLKSNKTHLDIEIENSNIVLSQNGERLKYFK